MCIFHLSVCYAGLVNGDDHDLVAELVGGLTSDYEVSITTVDPSEQNQ